MTDSDLIRKLSLLPPDALLVKYDDADVFDVVQFIEIKRYKLNKTQYANRLIGDLSQKAEVSCFGISLD